MPIGETSVRSKRLMGGAGRSLRGRAGSFGGWAAFHAKDRLVR